MHFLSVLHSWKMPDTKHISLFQNWKLLLLFFCDQIWPRWSHALCQRDINSLCLIWLSAEDSKALCFYLIWGTVWFYSRVYRPVWSIRLIRILHCHLLCRQCFKTSIFLFCQQPLLPQSHNNLYPTVVISQSKLSSTLRRRMLLVSRTKKKNLHWPSPLTSCSPKQGEGYRWKHCHAQDMLLRSTCAIFKWLVYIHRYL